MNLANSRIPNGVHKLQHVSVSTLDFGIQLLAQINPYADNLWRLLMSFYTYLVLTVHLMDISASQCNGTHCTENWQRLGLFRSTS